MCNCIPILPCMQNVSLWCWIFCPYILTCALKHQCQSTCILSHYERSRQRTYELMLPLCLFLFRCIFFRCFFYGGWSMHLPSFLFLTGNTIQTVWDFENKNKFWFIETLLPPQLYLVVFYQVILVNWTRITCSDFKRPLEVLLVSYHMFIPHGGVVINVLAW